MAEYFPLIDRAVAGLPDCTAEARRSIYERARAALIGQLRKTEPPIPEEDIARESTALDEAIARVEAKFPDHGAAPAPSPEPAARPQIASPAAMSTARQRTPLPPLPAAAGAPRSPLGARSAERPPLAPRRPASEPVASAPPAGARDTAAVAPVLPTGKVPPVNPAPARERPVIGPAPPVAAEARPGIAPARPLADRTTRPTVPVRPAAASPLPVGAEAQTSEAKAPSLPPAADLPMPPSEPRRAGAESDFETTLDEVARADAETGTPPPLRVRESSVRPAAPRPVEPRRFGWPAALMAAAVALVMIGVGIFAWKMRDRPEQLAAAHPAIQAPEGTPVGKIVDRAGTPDGSADRPGSGVAVPAPVGQNSGEGGTDAGQTIAVAQRAALLVDAPDEPQKIKAYTGTVVWHLDSVSTGQGQPLAPAIRADIDIPDAKLKVTMLVQKNAEPQLPASHTIEFHFIPQPDYSLGDITQINVPELRKDDAPSGDGLTGVPVTIANDNFLVGLSRGAAEAQNKRLITERNWFDVSVLFAPKRPGKLTFEKGADGARLWDQAFAAWGDSKTTP